MILRNRRRPGNCLLALVVWLCLAPAWRSNAATFTAALEHDTITLGESVTLSLTFSGGSPQDPPAPPEIPNLQIAYVGPSSQFSFINGAVSSTVTHNFQVTPRQAGDYTIPALTARVGAETLHTQPITLKVIKPGAPPPEVANSGKELALLKLALPRKDLFVGESVDAQLELYLRRGIQNISQFQISTMSADGFTTGKMTEGQRRDVQIGSSIYTVIPLHFALKPVKTGPLSLGPVTASVVLTLPSNRRRDMFDPFGMFNAGEQRQVTLATDREVIQVQRLPAESIPQGFTGAVGSYTLNVSAGPTNVAAGDPITVKVQISGHGAIDSVVLPEQAAWQGFNTYPPTTKVETTDALGLQGTKSFEQIVVPQNSDIHELPPTTFSFFDPEAKQYRTLTQPPVALIVRPGGSAPAPTIVTANRPSRDNQPPPQDIVPIKQRMGTVAQVGPLLVQQPWFLALQGVPVLAWVTALVWRKRSERLANNPRLRRQRRVAKIISDGLAELRRLAAAKKSDEFFANLFRLLQEQLGERLDLPASAITEAVIAEHLRPRSVAEPVLTAVQEIFQMCNLARYAPIKTSQELAAIIPKFEAVLRQLQGLNL